MLRIVELPKKINDITGLGEVSFTVEAGEFFARLGPSASAGGAPSS